jgi:hypothetical protein
MHVQGNPVSRSTRPPFAAAVVAMFASVIGVARAAEFDEKLKAPQAKNVEHLRLVAKAASQEFMETDLDRRAQLLRDESQARRRFDARWTVVHAVETRAPLGDLAEFGIVPNDKGEVHVDLRKYPQWDEFESRTTHLLSRIQVGALGTQLVNRGMTDADVAAISAYVTSHDAAAMERAAGLPVTLSFGKVVRKYDKVRRPVPKDAVVDYLYQLEAAVSEADRAWLRGLLDSLDPHAARILLSWLGELESTVVWAPSDLNAAIRDRLATFRQPDFEKRAAAEAVGGVK